MQVHYFFNDNSGNGVMNLDKFCLSLRLVQHRGIDRQHTPFAGTAPNIFEDATCHLRAPGFQCAGFSFSRERGFLKFNENPFDYSKRKGGKENDMFHNTGKF